jgi:hypothetical protein
MLYTKKYFLNKFCKKIKEEPFSWKELFIKIDNNLKEMFPKNKIIDLNSLKIEAL